MILTGMEGIQMEQVYGRCTLLKLFNTAACLRYSRVLLYMVAGLKEFYSTLLYLQIRTFVI